MYQHAVNLIIYFERLDRAESKAEGVEDHEYDKKPRPTILVFLPGIYEIKQMYKRLENWTQL